MMSRSAWRFWRSRPRIPWVTNRVTRTMTPARSVGCSRSAVRPMTAPGATAQPKSKLDEKLRQARTCYDHIAGVLGVGLAERLSEHEFVILGDEAGEVTPAGADFLSRLGVDLSAARAKRRVFCRPCVDWTRPQSIVCALAALAPTRTAAAVRRSVRASRIRSNLRSGRWPYNPRVFSQQE